MKITTSTNQWAMFILLLLMVCFLHENTLAQTTKTFTGSGNFSTAARWNGGTLPAAGDNLVIDGTCTVDNNGVTDNVAYGTLTVGTATTRTLNWVAGGTNRLNVTNIASGSATSNLDMSNGGTLVVRGTVTTTNMNFTPGNGTIDIETTLLIPYVPYFNNLIIGNSSATVTLSGDTNVGGSLTVTGTLQLAGYAMTSSNLSGTGIIRNSGSSTNLVVGSDNTPTTFSGVIGTGAIALTKNGTGTLTLSGNNTYTGLTTIAAGTLKLNNTNALGTTAGGTSVTSGAVLDLNGINYSNAETLTLNGTGISVGGALINSSATAAFYNGNITLGSATTVTANNAITLSGIITGAFSLTKNGSNVLDLSGLNTYTGTTTVNAGILRATNNTMVASTNGAFGKNASGLILNGGAIQSNVATFSRPITVTATNSGLDAYGAARTISSAINDATAASTFNLNIGGTFATGAEGQNLILSGVISNTAGSMALTKIGTSVLTLSGGNSYSGGTILNAGQVNINHTIAIGTGALTINGGIIDNTSGGTVTLTNNNAQNWNSDFTFTGTQSLSLGTGVVTLSANRQITVSANTLTVGGIINQSIRNLTKAGVGTLSFVSQTVGLNSLTISAGAIISTTGALNLSGNFSNSGIFTHNNGTVSFNGTTAQTIGGSASTTFNNLTIANTTSTVTLTINASIVANLTVTNGIFDLSSYTANRTGAGGTLSVSNNATLKIGGTNSYPTNYTTNTLATTSTVEYSGTTQTVKGQTYSNLTISGAGTNSKTASTDMTVNGILNLSSANASATHGCLEMSSYILTMGATATTIGTGDVTGIVKRTTFVTTVPYTFGNQFTTFTFNAGGTYPTQIQLKITIGTAPSWKTTAINRVYDLLQASASGCTATVTYHYLDSELNGNNENKLAHLLYGTPGPPAGLTTVGSSNINNTTDDWLAVSNANIQYLPTSFGVLQNTMIESDIPTFTWNGSMSSDWTDLSNWTPLGTPVSSSNVVIPDAATTPNDPTLPTSTEIKTLTIQSGGILNAVASEQLTLNGDNGAWSNNAGTFNPATSKVLFTNALATLAGTSNFYDFTISTGAALTLGSGSITRIAGTMTNNGILRAALLPNTIEYNGTSQAVINPNGGTPGYYNLILSGSGTKTLPGTAMSVAQNFTMSGSASTTAASGLTIKGNITLGSGNTLNLSSYTHNIGGNMTNNGGTFTPSTSSVIMNGSTSQTITSSFGISFNNLSITNTSANVTLGTSTNCSIAGDLTLNTGAVFDLAANSMTALTGTVYNSGTIKTQSPSSTLVPSGKTWGGTFEFTGATAQTIVGGTYNNVTTSGSGGITATANSTVNGILNLVSVNPSSTQGILEMGSYILLMGPSSTTIGTGDVTGIVRRTTIVANTTYTFGNQFTNINFPNVGTLPTEFNLKISIGTAPAWKPNAIKRIYDLSQTGGSGTQALLHTHYLGSELNGNRENLLVDWLYLSATPLLIDYGRSTYNTTDDWVAISNVNVGVFSSTLGQNLSTLGESLTTALTWNGSVSTSWVTAGNWTPNAAPSDFTVLRIPDAGTTPFDATLPAIATCGAMILQPGAILNSSSGAQLTINGAAGAWTNHGGVFNSGTSNIEFTNANASMVGASDFNNVTIDNGAVLALQDSTYMGISGTITNNGSLLTVEKGATTVEYKGGNQTVIVPDNATGWYSTLILSGSGTKTLPGTSLEIYNNCSILGTATVNAGAVLNLDGNLTIGNGATFNTGNFVHSLGGNLYNNSTFTSSSGSGFMLNGNTFQSIEGTGVTSFYNLSVFNTSVEGVFLNTDITVNNSLTINSGSILTINPAIKANVVGTITNNAGTSGLVIKSASSAANGTLIFHNAVNSPVAATVEMYTKASKPDTHYKWQFFGIPVRNTVASPTFDGSYVRIMHEDNNPTHWEQLNNASTLNSFTGYEITQVTPTTIYFQGQLENSDYAPAPLIFTSGVTFPGEHLFANPYTAAIDITQLTFGSQTDASVYLYNTGSLTDWTTNSGGSTNGVSPGQYTVAPKSTAGSGGIPGQIPSLQGFMVNALSSSVNATFGIPYSSVATKNTDQQRVHALQNSSASNKVFTRIDVKGTHFSDRMWIFSDPGCTHNFDNGWDGAKVLGTALSPQLYAIEKDAIYQVNSVDDMNNTALGFQAGEDSIYTLTFTNENLETKYSKVYLVDLKNNITTDMTQSGTEYAFTTSSKDTLFNRFKIITSLILENPTKKIDITIFNSHKMIFIHNLLKTNGELYVYDISGKFIETIHFSAEAITTVETKLPSGSYLLKGVSGDIKVNQIIVI